MLHTLEVRWFFPPSACERPRCFADSGGTTRTDWYAPVGDPGCGIKFREGQLEPKLRTRERGDWRFAAAAEGHVEEWSKWSLTFPDEDGPGEHLLRETGWIAVEKTRYLAQFILRDGQPHQVQKAPPEGQTVCGFEWTDVIVAGKRWSTIGLEASGPIAEAEQLLRVTAGLVLKDVPPGLLSLASSCGYPAWLLK